MMVLGLMSGTSADGADAAIVRLEGEPPTLRWEVMGHTHVPHPETVHDTPSNLPAATGARHPVVLSSIIPGNRRLESGL